MMMIKKLMLITILVVFVSCFKNKNADNMYLFIDLVIKQNDSIRIFYKTDGTINFNEKEAFWTKVVGNKKNQHIVIKFPENVLPNQFRIDFGNSNNQPGIIVNKIECQYKTNSFVFKGEEVYQVLRVDQSNTLLDKQTGILTRINKNLKNGVSLYPNGDNLKSSIDKLLLPQKN